MTHLRCIIVDDESLARQRFRSVLEKLGPELDDAHIEIIAEAENGATALELIHELKPDVIFLDIQMPSMTGFDVVDMLGEDRPHVVFVTAYDEYALRAFEVHALDYLTKPLSQQRLAQCLEHILQLSHRVEQHRATDALRRERESAPLARLTVQKGDRLRVVQLSEIRRIEAEDKSVHVYLADGRYRTDFTLDQLEKRLDSKEFMRVHRSHLVRIDAVREIIPWFSGSTCLKLDDGTQLPVARRRAAEVKALFGQ